ncbi:MAG: hypothetical protein WAO83_16175 [Fuerstiella sp.]
MSTESRKLNERTIVNGIGLVMTSAIFLVCAYRQVGLSTAVIRAVVCGLLCATAVRVLSRVIAAASDDDE